MALDQKRENSNSTELLRLAVGKFSSETRRSYGGCTHECFARSGIVRAEPLRDDDVRPIAQLETLPNLNRLIRVTQLRIAIRLQEHKFRKRDGCLPLDRLLDAVATTLWAAYPTHDVPPA